MHTSILLQHPIEFIETTEISPLISKVLIKVCYVSDEPNNNRSIITREVAKNMAFSLRGCPIVGFFNDQKGDFEEHNHQINISNGEWRITDSTRPYGFVDLNAKLWFATYLDDDQVEREYLCTEGYIWDHAYPEAKRILDVGNNQSMELDGKSLKATWSKDQNGKPKFFIINEALLSKLCILGEDVEPCFEGASITSFSLVIDETFQTQLYSMMNEIKTLLTKGGTEVFNTYAVEIGDALWSALYRYLEETYPSGDCCSKYGIDGIYEENSQKFAILFDRIEQKYYRLNFVISDEEGFKPSDTLIEVTKTYIPVETPQFDYALVEEYAAEYARKKKEEKSSAEDEGKNKDEENSTEEKSSTNDEEKEEEKSEEEEKPEEEEEDPKKKKKKNYSQEKEADEEEENVLQELQLEFNKLKEAYSLLEEENKQLKAFKLASERKEKENMIARFYMLSDEDKSEVITNIDKYSLEDIEAKLSVICVRNKVSFAEENEEDVSNGVTTFSLNDGVEEDSMPAWVKAALDVAKTL